MTAKKKGKPSFVEGMAALEERIAAINGGTLSLEETMKVYEEGVALAAQLEDMLAQHERRLERIDPDTGEIEAIEVSENDLS